MAYNIYPALSVTVTQTPQKLYSLIAAVDSTIAPRGREVTFQSAPTNTANLYFGSSNSVAPTACGYVLTPNTSRTYRADSQNDATALPNIWVVADGSGNQQLNIEIIPK